MHLLSPQFLRVVRYIISGGSSAIVNLGTLYVLTEFFGLWYLFSAVIAFLLSFAVSFTLQKFWTFRDRGRALVLKQVLLYFAVALFNLFLDIGVLYLLVEYVGLHYLVAQVLTFGFIAVVSFFVYRRFIFTESEALADGPVLIPLSHMLVILAAAFTFTFAPYLIVTHQLGGPMHVPVGIYDEGDYYFERMQEIHDGHPLMGNQFYFEHRQDLPPAFFLADWIGAIPLLLGFPFIAVVHIDFFGSVLFFLALSYLVYRILGLTGKQALVAGIVACSAVLTLLLRPVSMQVIYPAFGIFLLAFLMWLQEPSSRARQIGFGLASAFGAALYTYLWQIALCVFLVSALGFALVRRDSLKALILPAVIFVSALVPVALLTLAQSQDPFYLETLARIGLVYTHMPIAAGLAFIFVPALAGILAFSLKPRAEGLVAWLARPDIFFFASTGLSILGVMLSNIVTGLDLELPQHVGRFLVPWFFFSALYFSFDAWKTLRIDMSSFRAICIAFALALSVMPLAYFEYTSGIGGLFVRIDERDERTVQDFTVVFDWLRQNVASESIIWTDPNGRLSSYVAMLGSSEYQLYNPGGALQLISDDEQIDRYLTAHYFSLTKEQLIQEHRNYAGVGNAIHRWKTHNREVFVCKLFQLPQLGVDCGATVPDDLSYTGPAYFDALYQKYLKDVKPHIAERLKEYGVQYIVTDKLTDTASFKPGTVRGAKKIYDDDRFTIYSYGL